MDWTKVLKLISSQIIAYILHVYSTQVTYCLGFSLLNQIICVNFLFIHGSFHQCDCFFSSSKLIFHGNSVETEKSSHDLYNVLRPRSSPITNYTDMTHTRTADHINWLIYVNMNHMNEWMCEIYIDTRIFNQDCNHLKTYPLLLFHICYLSITWKNIHAYIL